MDNLKEADCATPRTAMDNLGMALAVVGCTMALIAVGANVQARSMSDEAKRAEISCAAADVFRDLRKGHPLNYLSESWAFRTHFSLFAADAIFPQDVQARIDDGSLIPDPDLLALIHAEAQKAGVLS